MLSRLRARPGEQATLTENADPHSAPFLSPFYSALIVCFSLIVRRPFVPSLFTLFAHQSAIAANAALSERERGRPAAADLRRILLRQCFWHRIHPIIIAWHACQVFARPSVRPIPSRLIQPNKKRDTLPFCECLSLSLERRRRGGAPVTAAPGISILTRVEFEAPFLSRLR